MEDISRTRKQGDHWWVSVWIAACFLWIPLGVGGCVSLGDSSGQRMAGQQAREGSAEAFSREVVALVAARDIASLARLVDPAQGLTFSPYGFVDRDNAVTLHPEDLVSAWRINKSFAWGSYDGSGDPIELPIREYFDRFVYDNAFSTTDQISVGSVIPRGNSLVNHDEVFEGATVVEFHVPGTNPRYGGLDWASLRTLLIQNLGEGWWLRGLVHDQWTI